MERLIDKFGREIYYLRISVTDRCNYRCIYCMPKDGINWKPMNEILSFEEITDFVKVAASLGIRKIKLTGGEPLVRKGVQDLIAMLKSIDGIEEVSLTTNGSLLKRFGRQLKASGLDRVTVSIDTLKRDKFRVITRLGNLDDVIAGVETLNELGFKKSKINTVVMKGINDDEIVDLVDFAKRVGFDIRFIELMPTDLMSDWKAHFISVDDVRSKIEKKYALLPSDKKTNGPAVYFRLDNVYVGFITPLSHAFCSVCNRIRLTSDGFILPCLGHPDRVDVKGVLRISDLEKVKELIRYSVKIKPKEHSLLCESIHSSMASVGG